MTKRFNLLLPFFVCAIIVAAEADMAQNVAILEFDTIGVSHILALSVTVRLSSILVESKKYTVIERDRVAEILREQGLQQTGCTSSSCMVEAGQLLGVQTVIAGSVVYIKEKKGYQIWARMVDVSTGKISRIVQSSIEDDVDVLLKNATNEVAGTLANMAGVGSVQISSRHKDINLYLNGVFKGAGIWRIDSLIPGEYEIKAQKPDLSDFDSTITIFSDSVSTLNVTFANPYRLGRPFLISGTSCLLASSGLIILTYFTPVLEDYPGHKDYVAIALYSTITAIVGVAGTVLTSLGSRNIVEGKKWQLQYGDTKKNLKLQLSFPTISLFF